MTHILLATLRSCWARGIDRVSAGTLGMVMRNEPFWDREVIPLARIHSDVVQWDGMWLTKVEAGL